MPRYFFALWPDDAVRRQLQAVSKRLPDTCGRKVRTENLHITLLFLGHVENTLMEGMRSAAADISGRQFTLSLDRHGWWKRPRVIWLGTDTVPPALAELAGALNGIAAAHGIAVDAHRFTPHLTLVRKANRPPAGFSSAPVIWNIREFVLVQSLTHASGAEYQVVQNWPLT